jgi:small subunit ribosomal protein S4
VLVRLGLAATRAQARQFISHGHITVDGRRVDIASVEVSPGQTIALRTGAPIEAPMRDATKLVSAISAWLEADHDQLSGRVLREPEAGEIQAPVAHDGLKAAERSTDHEH